MLALWFCVPRCAASPAAIDLRHARMFSLYVENDTFDATDRFYTNGVKLTWVSQILNDYRQDAEIIRLTAPLVKRLTFMNQADSARALSISLGHEIYTPTDTHATELLVKDRPYTGLAYYQLGFHNYDAQRMRSLEMTLGIVGPHAYAQEVQAFYHHWTGNPKVNGWPHQLRDEPLVGVAYEDKRKLRYPFGASNYGADVIRHIGGGLGNAFTYASGGLGARLGWKLPHDFGNFGMRPISHNNAVIDERDPRFTDYDPRGVHLFAGVDGLIFLRNITLDGNTFAESHHVEKEPFIANVIAGFGVIYGRCKITGIHFTRTKEFATQPAAHEFWSLNLSIAY